MAGGAVDVEDVDGHLHSWRVEPVVTAMKMLNRSHLR